MKQQPLLCFSAQQPRAGTSVSHVVCLLTGSTAPVCSFNLTPGPWVFSLLMKGTGILGKDLLDSASRGGGSEDPRRSPTVPCIPAGLVTSRFPLHTPFPSQLPTGQAGAPHQK